MKYKIIVDKQPSINPTAEKRTYEIDIEELRVKGNVYDSLIITKDEAYVMRRLSLSEYHVLSVLENEVKEPLTDLDITLFEGDNYIYLMDLTGNKFYAEYLVKNDFTDIYATRNEMHAAIVESAGKIELSVNQKLTGYSTTEEMNAIIQALANAISLEVSKKVNGDDFTSANIILMINNDQSQSKINADMIDINANDVLNILAGNEMNFTTKNLSIKSTNFSVTKDGKVTATSGEIGGFELGANDFKSNISIQYSYTSNDVTRIQQIIMGNITPTSTDYEKYNFTQTGTINAIDLLICRQIVNGTRSGKGTYTFNTKNAVKSLQIVDNDLGIVASLGLFGAYFNRISCKAGITSNGSISVQNNSDNSRGTVQTGEYGGAFFLTDTNGNYVCTLNVNSRGNISCVTLTQTSLEKDKKNFEKLENALEILKNIDICKYNFKDEDSKTKKHIGFVIGENYKYREEVTSNENDGVDLYSFVSLCCKAIQEEDVNFQELKAIVREKKKEINYLKERLEALENG